MSWNYLPELEEVFSERTFSAFEQSELLKSNPIAGKSCCNGSGILLSHVPDLG